MKAAIVSQPGGPDAIEILDRPDPVAAAGQVVVRVAYAGVNFVDIYQREGRYPRLSLPWPLGIEASGVIESVGDGVQAWSVGDRVAFTTGAQGSYAERIAVPVDHLVRVPDALSLQTACTAIEQGLTAMVLRDDVARWPLDAAKVPVALVHAAAGGVGGLLVQLLRQRGIRVIGTASSEAKRAWLRQFGVEALAVEGAEAAQASGQMNASVSAAPGEATPPWAEEVLRLTAGRGAEVVFDSVGLSTFAHSLQVLAPRGHLVLFGAASGLVPPFDPMRLAVKSATLTRPAMPHYLSDPAVLRQRAAALFDAVSDGRLQLRLHGVLPLHEAAQAQALLASRGTQGKLLLAVNPPHGD